MFQGCCIHINILSMSNQYLIIIFSLFRFPPSIVAVDVSGKPFQRMTGMRRSLMGVEMAELEGGTLKRRTKRRHRGKRRNTIAGTSQKEIEQAIAG